MRIRRILPLLLVLGLVACATTEEPVQDSSSSFTNAISDGDYNKLIDTYSVKEEKYSGFYSTYQFQATILNSAVQEAQLALKAQDFKWPRETYFGEKEKISESLSKESKVFVSFFSPVAENDNLDSNKTIWKLYLVVNGVRHEGIASKLPGILAQHQRLYPYHTRFFTPYVLTFKIPMGRVQTSETSLIITGPIGTSEVKFPSSGNSTF